jgi:hypothetical protein
MSVHVYIGFGPTYLSVSGTIPPPLYTSRAVCWTSAYICMNTYPTHFVLEDGGSMYLRNIGSTAHIGMVQGPKSRTSTMRHRPSLKQ